jgi:hypothetical protein
MVKAIGRPKEKLCLYCWTGQCPKKGACKPTVEIKEVKKTSKKSRAKQKA